LYIPDITLIAINAISVIEEYNCTAIFLVMVLRPKKKYDTDAILDMGIERPAFNLPRNVK